jgi:hypothetical protein
MFTIEAKNHQTLKENTFGVIEYLFDKIIVHITDAKTGSFIEASE